MTEQVTITLISAAREHFKDLDGDEASSVQAEVERFVRWAGADRQLAQLTANEVANYGETLSGTVTDATRRGEAVKRFLAFVKKAGYTPTNLGTHLRVKRSSKKKTDKTSALDQIEMTLTEKVALEAELAELKAQRPQIIEDIKRAMADKDFKENAPLDAARDQQGYVEGRIRKLEFTIGQVVVVEASVPKGDVVEVGCKVELESLESGNKVAYTLVRSSEIDAAQGKISYESPVGQALMNKRAGDEVDVSAPSGLRRFRIVSVEV